MVKYVDAGYSDDSGGKGKKKVKKGFKSDRHDNYKRMIAKKLTGKEVKKKEKAPTRVKSIVFDDAARRNYLLTLHKKKNERRVQAFVDVKRKMRKDNARTRREQREEARRAYNNYAKVPILPNYTYQLPVFREAGESDDEETEEGAPCSPADEGIADVCDSHELPWVSVLGTDQGSATEDSKETARRQRQERKRTQRLVTEEATTHSMPSVMMGGGDDALPSIDADYVTVEVKPLFAARPTIAAPSPRGDHPKSGDTHSHRTSALPSHDFSDLPAVVEQELRRLRQEVKGPARTKSRVHMLKELEKINKIRKYSRKGHGKKTARGKRKNRKK